MRARLAKALRKTFDDLLKKELPFFKPVEPREIEIQGKKEKEIPPGWRLYLWDYSQDLYFYLLLNTGTQKTGDSFTVECAWTRNGRFPAMVGLMFPYDIPRARILADKPKNDDFRFRIGQLWQPGLDHWWWLAPRPSFEEMVEWSLSEESEKTLGLMPPETPVEEALQNVVPCVEDAIRHIVKYAVPYFENVIRHNH